MSETTLEWLVSVFTCLKQLIGSHTFIVPSKLELINLNFPLFLRNIIFEMMSLCAMIDWGGWSCRRFHILMIPSLEPEAT